MVTRRSDCRCGQPPADSWLTRVVSIAAATALNAADPGGGRRGKAVRAGPEIRSEALSACPVAGGVGLRRIVAGLHLDALVLRVIYRAQGHGGRVDRVPDLYRPLAGVQVGLVDGLVRIDHRQSDRAA